ncbi:sigma-54-dependent transcriptional regulator [Colwellia psychrerythraea]|uniref:Sigma-54 dependent DNA-binding response regulator, Fis family n=1 Tax=Colwellia psychrerythraea (strain 34H / ATCC BAA-681) TaxID=167879 RepID=Q489D8_COLP3|nr:sigma-54 dependent transcriptional regulator [Colwellia psychrerythraea]AAZ26462.1 sigma-54 dependent DNA-binding response regulator, Fis family [Colwellia psychrerythraea 34H]
MPQILIVDDNPDILEALELLLSLHGYAVLTAENEKQALLAVSHQRVDLVIQDMNFAQGITSGKEGKSLFTALKALNSDLPIILITAWTQLETAISLVKSGATDYLQKPWDDVKLLDLVAKYSLNSKINQDKNNQSVSNQKPADDFIYKSQEMQTLISQASKVAGANVNVLITGANGAGKEKLADYIHQQSPRYNSAFIKVNMGALPHDLMEAELFGAEKGAFTGANQARIGRFEAADGGTLFLDEIANLTLAGQMKLLRVLQTGEFERLGANATLKVDVRVLSATNADLRLAVQQGTFREDLYYRLNVIELNLPDLAYRKADIVPLAQYFIGNDCSLSDEAAQTLTDYTWPGNVRELENACKRALVFANSSTLTASDFQLASSQKEAALGEKGNIEQVLIKHKGVIKHTALELGLSRQALYRRIEKYQIDVGSLC